MRTTIEISDEMRARLLAVAARRGLKGFSSIVEEALAAYLSRDDGRAEKIQAALRLQGSLSREEARQLRENTAMIRRSWR